MLFNSLQFLVFLPVVMTLYFAVHSRYRNLLLLLASYYFYMVFSIPLAGLLVWSTFIDFYLARKIHRSEAPAEKRLYLAISMVSNLGLLFLFKYYNLFAFSFGSLMGSEANWVSSYIVLPMGISFYTFQTMSYTIDVYRGELEPTDSLLKMALYVSFFPQLVAGPIMRGKTLMPQLDRTYEVNIPRMKSGFYLCVWGLMKKTFVADPMGRVVDSVYPSAAAPWLPLEPGIAPVDEFSSLALLVATYAFAIQIYCDFSAYSDIAIGCGRMMGYRLSENFRQPYLSTSIREFWRHWHISLSTWLRDYLYIPLGGNKKGKVRTYVNLSTTMLLGGLWHGANWTFVVWGALHGLYLSLERAYSKNKETKINSPLQFARFLLTFHLVCLAWIYFRAPTIWSANEIVLGIFSFKDGKDITLFPVALLVIILLYQASVRVRDFKKEWGEWGWPMRYACYAVVFACAIVFAGSPSPEFIYFQF